MKNKFEKRGDHYAIFANGSGMQHEIFVDETDFEEVAAFPGTWGAHKDGNTFYACTYVRDQNGKWKNVQMHRVLLNPPADLQVDHLNHNGLDNRRKNIRIATCGENARNRINNVEFQSDISGVHWNARGRAWVARPWVNGKEVHLGYFDKECEAEAAVYMFLETGMRVKRILSASEFQSDVPGVTWHALSKAWMARLRVNGRDEYLGLFGTAPEAHAAVCMFRETGMRVKRRWKNRKCAG